MIQWKYGVMMLLTIQECILKYTQFHQPEVSIFVSVCLSECFMLFE